MHVYIATVPGLEVRRYVPVWYTSTSLVGLKSYRHFFLTDCHTGMQCTKFGQLIIRKICFMQMRFIGAKSAKNAFAAGALPAPRWGSLQRSPRPLAGFKGAYF